MAFFHVQRRRWTLTPYVLASPVVLATAIFVGIAPSAGCEGEPLAEDQLCGPGENIFCRCPGGDPGTKACTDAGDGFGECGPCSERPSSGPGQQGVGASGAGAGPGGGGFGGVGGDGGGGSGADGGMGGGGTIELLSPCVMDGGCVSGMCRFNFCTKPCGAVSECPYPASECVSALGQPALCMPACDTAVDCAPFEAPPSRCGFARAVDNWGVTVCAYWDTAHMLMPDGTDCLPFDHAACNLGYQGQQKVCSEQGICTPGCYSNTDCADPMTCSGQGTLGNCQ